MYRFLFFTPIFVAVSAAVAAAQSPQPGVTQADLQGIIRDLRIEKPDARPYLTLKEWMDESPAAPAGVPPQRRAALLRAWATFWLDTQPAQGPWWTHPIIGPGFRYLRGIWIWDTGYNVLGLAYGGPKARQLALWQIEVLLHAQEESGRLPREVFKDGPKKTGQHGVQAPGMLTLAANRLFEVAAAPGEKESVRKALADFYQRFQRNHEWFLANTKGDRGLCVWNGMDAGWDNSPRWADGGAKEALDLNCYLYLDRVELAQMARSLGREDEARDWNAKADALAALVRAIHYDPKLGVFNDTRPDGSVSPRLSPVIYLPLWVGIASPEQARGSLKFIGDPKTFGAAWPLPTVALSDPAYRPGGRLWQGQTWINVNWHAIRGLQRCGFRKEAEALRQKTLDLIEKWPLFWECYHPETGVGLKTHNYGWTAACYIDLVLSQ
ncbi:MAG: trehalase family glycosidase [Thermoguttaceae bacterium]|jgi:putative isomerase